MTMKERNVEGLGSSNIELGLNKIGNDVQYLGIGARMVEERCVLQRLHIPAKLLHNHNI